MKDNKNIRLGIDFDNTIISYDNVFYNIAISKRLIPKNISRNKLAIRNYLRSIGKDQDFTLLQAEAYGPGIRQAIPQPGVIELLSQLRRKRISMKIISHKTKNPYKGPCYDLHQWAIYWLEKQGFFDKSRLSWNIEDVFFEESKERKRDRILKCVCTHYIDDLPEILDMLPDSIQRIHYCPSGESSWEGGLIIKNWSDLKLLFKE